MILLNQLLPWQQQNWHHLCHYILQKRIPQALLITGKKGLGKQHLANQFAFSLLCATPQPDGLSCGHCDSCKLLSAETHPDFICLNPEEPGKAITVGQLRSLIAKLTLKPQFEAYRVVVINPAEQMNNAAANAFLKSLEEPTERTIIVLITDKPAKLPATIVSRCQKLAVDTPDEETISSWFKLHNLKLSHGNISILFGLAQGAPLLMLEYARDETLKLRNKCFNAWIAIAKQRNHPVIIAEEWYKLPEAPLIFWITSWVIDLIRCFYEVKTEDLYNPDLNEPLQELSQRLELKGIYKLYDLLLNSRQRLGTQINKQLMFEEILIQWSELNLSG
jgi:DNA polymerase-3 subunit delta'